MTAKLMLRQTTESFKENLCYSEESEEWQTDIGLFFYYYFHAPEQQFHLKVVDFSLCVGGSFDCSGPPIWVVDIMPIALIALAEKSVRRLYGANWINYSIGYLPAFIDRYNAEPDSLFSRMYENDQTKNRNSPQATLERLCEVHKPDKWSWEQIIDLVYGNIMKARDVLLDSAKQIPNEYVANVIGGLELRKPIPKRFSLEGKNATKSR